MKKIIVDGMPYNNVLEVTILGGKYSEVYDEYAGCFAYVDKETNTIFIDYPHRTPLLLCDVDGEPMIPLFSNDFDYVVNETHEGEN